MKAASRIKIAILPVLAIAFAGMLCGCAAAGPPQGPGADWAASAQPDEIPPSSNVLMEMAYDTYGTADQAFSYTLTNTSMDTVTFDSAFSLEYSSDGKWLVVPFKAGFTASGTKDLPGMQMCRIDIDTSVFDSALPLGDYRIIQMAGDETLAAEFTLADQRADARDMNFGYEPMASLPADYDDVSAESDGCYTIADNGVTNSDRLQRFADKVSLGVPDRLRTVIMLSDNGGAIVRDIVFDPSPDGNSRFFVEYDKSRITDSQPASEQEYSYLSIAMDGYKKKLCLSNYISYTGSAPAGAPLEIISPNVSENIDLIATVEQRTEKNTVEMPYICLVYGSDGVSYAAIQKNGTVFDCKSGGTLKTYSFPDNSGVTLNGVKWLSDTVLSLSGVMADGQSYQTDYDLEAAPAADTAAPADTSDTSDTSATSATANPAN